MQEKDYNPIEMRRHRDTDGDGIPDSADSRYTKPDDDYQYRRISESDYDRLRGAGLDNKVECKHDTQSAGTLIIRYQDSQAAEIDRVLRHTMHPVQKM
jgi:hypothetical protein